MRTMSKRIVLGLSAAVLAIALAGAAFSTSQIVNAAQGPGGRGGPGRFGGPGGGGPMGRGGRGGPGGPMGVLGPMMLERLGLTADQNDRVKQILDSHRDEQQAVGKRAMAAHEALQAAI